MDIQNLAAWGEFLGGIGGLIAAVAIVVSLMFVGSQIRHSANASQATVRHAVSESVINLTKLLLNDSVSLALRKDRAGDEIDEDDRQLLGAYFTIFWRTYENAFYQFRKGLLEEHEWRSHRTILRSALENSNASKFTFDLFTRGEMLPPAFTHEVETVLNEVQSSKQPNRRSAI
jgi:hypothetical protein